MHLRLFLLLVSKFLTVPSSLPPLEGISNYPTDPACPYIPSLTLLSPTICLVSLPFSLPMLTLYLPTPPFASSPPLRLLPSYRDPNPPLRDCGSFISLLPPTLLLRLLPPRRNLSYFRLTPPKNHPFHLILVPLILHPTHLCDLILPPQASSLLPLLILLSSPSATLRMRPSLRISIAVSAVPLCLLS